VSLFSHHDSACNQPACTPMRRHGALPDEGAQAVNRCLKQSVLQGRAI